MLRGAPNFRDVGGLRTAGGRTVRERALLRSGHLGELQPEDIALLGERLGQDICVIDLRSEAERAKVGCVLPGAVVHALPIEPSVARRLDALAAAGEPTNAAIARGFMCEAYRNFVRLAQPQLAAAFTHAVDRAGRPMVVHCAQGKDRTGFVIAMLLSALDVPRDTVMEDYLLTNERVPPREGGRYAPEIMQVLNGVRAEYLEAAFATVDTEFGGTATYLAAAAGLTAARRRGLEQALLSP